MAEWGSEPWGLGSWGGLSDPEAPGDNEPVIVARSPAPGANDVNERALVAVVFFDPDGDLDTSTVLLEINGDTVYNGAFASSYVGSVNYTAGAFSVQAVKLEGWGFDQTITVRGKISDSAGHTVDDTWKFNTRPNPICYAGLDPLAIEQAIQNPMTTFLTLEPLRKRFMSSALKTQEKSINNKGNKAARVLYKLAFDTELSTVLNPFGLRDEEALNTIVCERQNTKVIDTELSTLDRVLENAILELGSLGGFTDDYIRTFNDYKDSTLYSYRVSLVANLLLAAKSKELE